MKATVRQAGRPGTPIDIDSSDRDRSVAQLVHIDYRLYVAAHAIIDALDVGDARSARDVARRVSLDLEVVNE